MFIALLFGVLSILLVREPEEIKNFVEDPNGNLKGNGERNRSIVAALASIFLFSSVGGILMSIFPSYATDLGISAFDIGIITFTFGFARALVFYQANNIETYIKKTGMFLAGSTALGFASLVTLYSNTTLSYVICFLIFGFGSGISYAASIASLLRWRRSSRGYSAGLFESLIGIGYFFGPLTAGFLSEFADNAPYLYSLFLSLVVILIQLGYKYRFTSD